MNFAMFIFLSTYGFMAYCQADLTQPEGTCKSSEDCETKEYCHIQNGYASGNCKQDFLLPYATIRSESCESNDMSPILIKEECVNITGFFSKLDFNSGYDYNGQVETWGMQNVYNLNVPFGCLYTNEPKDGVFWSAPISVQPSLPCGSKSMGKEYYCFCKRKNCTRDNDCRCDALKHLEAPKMPQFGQENAHPGIPPVPACGTCYHGYCK